jgi:hypothetical protein
VNEIKKIIADVPGLGTVVIHPKKKIHIWEVRKVFLQLTDAMGAIDVTVVDEVAEISFRGDHDQTS